MTSKPTQRLGMPLRAVLLIFSAVLVSAAGNSANAQPISIQNAAGIKVSVAQEGAYTIVCDNPAWIFGGDVGRPLTSMSSASGRDSSGSYDEISFSYFDGASKQA